MRKQYGSAEEEAHECVSSTEVQKRKRMIAETQYGSPEEAGSGNYRDMP